MKLKFVITIVILNCLVLIMGASVFARDVNKSEVSGGWSENSGYYIDGVEGTTSTYIPSTSVVSRIKINNSANNVPSATPNKHTGKRLDRAINSAGDVESAAHGETVWYYKYHYTTARMELSNGTVKTTSGRQWGNNATQATSPYYTKKLFENTEARTYWGS